MGKKIKLDLRDAVGIAAQPGKKLSRAVQAMKSKPVGYSYIHIFYSSLLIHCDFIAEERGRATGGQRRQPANRKLESDRQPGGPIHADYGR